MAISNVIEFVVKLKDQASPGLSAIGSRLKGLGSIAGGLVAGVGIVSTITKVISATTEAEKAMARFDIAFNNLGKNSQKTRDDLVNFADEMGKRTIFDDEAILAAQTALLSFQSVSGKTFDRARDAAIDLASALGTDLTSAAQIVGRAIERPEVALRQLRSAGIVFSRDQEKTIKKLVETGERAKAASIILGELERRTAGAAERMANTLGGAVQRLGNAWDNLFEVDATDLTKAIGDIADTINDPSFRTGIQSLISGLLKVVEVGAKVASTIGNIGKGLAIFAAGGGDNEVVNATMAVERLLRERDRQMAMAGRAGANAENVRAEIRARYQPLIDAAMAYEREAMKAAEQAANAFSSETARGVESAIGSLNELEEVVVHVFAKARSPMEEYYERLQDLTKTSVEKQIDALDEFEVALERLYRDGIISAEQFNARWKEKFDDAMSEVQVTVKAVVVQPMKTAFDEIVDSFTTAMERMLNNGKLSWRSLGEYFLREVTSGFIRKAIEEFRILVDGLFKSLKGMGSSTGYTWGSSIPGTGGPVWLPKKAGGGMGTGLQWVGENGPELAGSASAMRVYNLRQLAGMGLGRGASIRGGDTNITVNGNADNRAIERIRMIVEQRIARSEREQQQRFRRPT
jgi:phage terminase Nu1 subunit (DNA packaging protein)